ncbi:MAG TPA: MFS transporter [Kineosporiaceae bacterium]|nr:MFS transporter [Kineosporiaceae bacterium]
MPGLDLNTQGGEPVDVAASAPDASTAAGGHPWRWWILAVVLMAEVLDLLDATVVNVAAPSIREDLGGAVSMIQWVAAGYTLAFGVLLVVGGRLGDRFGRRRMFLIGAVGFTTASVASALATSPGMLISFRVLQGALGAVLIPQGLGVIKAVFPADQLGKAFSAFGPVIGLSAVCGPILAGALIDLDAWGSGWRMIFLINLPLGILAVYGAAAWMPKDPPRPEVVIDGLSGALLAIASLLVIYPLIQGPERGWPLWTYLSLIGGLLVALGFGYRERFSADPLIAPGLWRNRSFASGMLLGLVFFASVSGLMLTISLFIQSYLHYTPLRAGLTMAPMALGIVVGSLAAYPLIPKLGRRLLLIGLVVDAVAALALAEVVHHFGEQTGNLALFGPTLMIGIGMAGVFAPLFDVILAGVSEAESGSASGTLTAMQQLAGAVGVAGITTVFLALGKHHSGSDAMALSTVVVAALVLLGCALVFLLPKQARSAE